MSSNSFICTEVFPGAVVATAWVEGDTVAVAIVRPDDRESAGTSFEMKVDKISSFLDRCRQVAEPRIHHLADPGVSHE